MGEPNGSWSGWFTHVLVLLALLATRVSAALSPGLPISVATEFPNCLIGTDPYPHHKVKFCTANGCFHWDPEQLPISANLEQFEIENKIVSVTFCGSNLGIDAFNFPGFGGPFPRLLRGGIVAHTEIDLTNDQGRGEYLSH